MGNHEICPCITRSPPIPPLAVRHLQARCQAPKSILWGAIGISSGVLGVGLSPALHPESLGLGADNAHFPDSRHQQASCSALLMGSLWGNGRAGGRVQLRKHHSHSPGQPRSASSPLGTPSLCLPLLPQKYDSLYSSSDTPFSGPSPGLTVPSSKPLGPDTCPSLPQAERGS